MKPRMGSAAGGPAGKGRAALVFGLLILLLIVGMLAWVVLTFPRPGWRDPPAVPTTPPPASWLGTSLPLTA